MAPFILIQNAHNPTMYTFSVRLYSYIKDEECSTCKVLLALYAPLHLRRLQYQDGLSNVINNYSYDYNYSYVS